MGTPAARVGDQVAHSNAMMGLLIGAALGAALAVAVVATGGLAAVAAGAMIAGGIAGGALAGEYAGAASMGPPTGTIMIGSPNVIINGRPATMTNIAMAICSKEYGVPQPIAQGAATVIINGMHAARKNDKLVCGAMIIDGSGDVFFDDRTVQTLDIAPDVPPWLNKTLEVVVVASAVVGFGAAVAAVGFGAACAGLAGSLVGGWAGKEGGRALGQALGLSESGQRALEAGGGLLGGFLGGAAGAKVYEGLGANPEGIPTQGSEETPCQGEPISMHTGEELLSVEDFSWRGPITLAWKRFYRTTQSATDLQLGYGWLTPLDEWIEPAEDGGLVFHDREGRRIRLPLPAVGGYGVNSAERLRIERTPTHLCIRADRQPDRLFAAHAGRSDLCAWRQAGHQIDIVRDASGKATMLRASWGRVLVIDREGHRISRITPARIGASGMHPIGAPLVRYVHDAQGDLVQVLDRLDQGERYEYAGHLITRRTLATGFNFRFAWDGDGPRARCVRNWGDEGIFDYRFEWDVARGWSRCIDSRGGMTDYVHDESGRLVRTTSPENVTTSYSYSARGLLAEISGPLGTIASYEYDADGRLAKSVDAMGGAHEMGWDTQGRLASVRDPLGHERRWDYDEHGRLRAETDALGATTRYSYNGQGLLSQVVRPSGQVRVLWWDADARLVAELGFDGLRRHFAYDQEDRIVGATTQEQRGQSFEWDAVGRLVRHRAESGAEVRMRYDARGNLTHWTDAAGNTTQYRRREGLSQLSERIDPLGQVLRYHYDTERNLVGLTNAKGERYGFSWDKDDRLVEQVGFDGRTQRYRYDRAGRVVAQAERDGVDASGQARWRLTQLRRDPLGRLVEKKTPDGRVCRYAYDAVGRLLQADTDEHSLRMRYDALGRLVEERQGDAVVSHELDVLGRRTVTRLPDGHALQFEWNRQHRLDQVLVDGRPISRHQWDQFAQEVERQQGDLRTRYDYDPAGRLVGQSACMQGDERVVIERGYRRDVAGRITAIHDVRQGDCRYVYDPAGQLLEASGITPERFVQDPAGNLLMDGASVVEADRLLVQGDRHFRYDAAGNRIEERRGTGGARVTNFEYDGAHRLVAVHGPSGTSRYRYDALGRRIAKVTPKGETRFVWDGTMLLGESSGQGASRWYVYEPGTFRPLALLQRKAADASSASASDTSPPARPASGDAPFDVFHYHLDHLGTPREVTDARGRIVWSGRYKTWGALAVADIAEIDNPLRLPGQYHDEETGLHYNFQRYYDPAVGRFINQDPIGLQGGLNLYRYVHDPIGWMDPWGLDPIMVDPSTINFSQSWVSPNNYADVMAQKGWIGDPLNVMERNGQLVSFDNRRLAAAQANNMSEVPVNMVKGTDPYPPSTTGKTWDDAFNERLGRNGLGPTGTPETPAVGKVDGAQRIAENRSNRVGCG
jgi:RHS repeat-associated protein